MDDRVKGCCRELEDIGRGSCNDLEVGGPCCHQHDHRHETGRSNWSVVMNMHFERMERKEQKNEPQKGEVVKNGRELCKISCR